MDDDSLRVLDPRGKRVDDGKPSGTGGATYSVKLHAGLPDGTYTVTYQVVSADSHPVAGAYTFSVGAPSETSVAVSGQSAGGGFVGGLYGVGRYVSYTGFAVLVGGAAFVLACWPRGSGVRVLQRVVVSGWLALTAATLLLLLLRGSYTGSGKFADVFDLNLLGEVLQTKPGAALVSRLLLLAAAALFIAVLFGAYDKREDEEKRDLTFGLAVGGSVVAAGLAATWAMSEHASVGLQAGLAMPVDVVHLIAVATWLGGLTALLVALYRGPADTPVPALAVRRFSRVAFGSVIALVVTGTYQSWRQLGSWTAFTDTRYGQLLLVKIGLVAVLVGVAHFSRRWTAQLAEAAPAVAGAAAARRAEKGAGKASTKASTKASGTASAKAGTKASGNAKVAQKTSGTTKGSGTAKGTGTAKARAPRRLGRLTARRTARPAARGRGRRPAEAATGRRSEPLRAAPLRARRGGHRGRPAGGDHRPDPDRTGPHRGGGQGRRRVLRGRLRPLHRRGDAGHALRHRRPERQGSRTGRTRPARVGANDMHLYVERPDGTAFDLPEVKVALTQKAKSIGPLPVAPDHITTGHWSASGVQIPMAGDWEVAVTVRTSDIDQVTISKNTQIG